MSGQPERTSTVMDVIRDNPIVSVATVLPLINVLFRLVIVFAGTEWTPEQQQTVEDAGDAFGVFIGPFVVAIIAQLYVKRWKQAAETMAAAAENATGIGPAPVAALDEA